MSIEAARKHGAFDPRYPPIPHEPAPAARWSPGEERTGWEGFLARFYPTSRRHDFHALAAYEAYRHGVEDRARPEREAPAAAVEAERWEGEGGAVAERLRHRRGGERRVAPRAVQR